MRNRQFLIVLLVAFSILFGAGAYLNETSLRIFGSIEDASLQRQVTRVENAFKNKIEEHKSRLSDWAQWDKTYDFVLNLDESYKKENLNEMTMSALSFEDVLFFDQNNTFVFGATTKSESGDITPADAVVSDVKRFIESKSSQSQGGLINVGAAQFIIAAAPILPNKADLAPRGMIVALSKLDEAIFEQIRYATNLKVSFQPNLKNQTWTPQRPLISGNLIQVSGVLIDVFDHSLVEFKITVERAVSEVGSTVQMFTFATVLSTLVLLAVFIWQVVYGWASKRIDAIANQISQIADGKKIDHRLNNISQSYGSIRRRTVFSVVVFFMAATLVLGIVLDKHFLRGFEKLELNEVADDVIRARRALKGRLDSVQGKAIDWAQWDDSYQFIEDGNTEYSEANLGFDTLGPMGFKYVFYVDTNRSIKASRLVNGDKGEVAEVRSDITSAILRLVKDLNATTPKAGFARIAGENLLFGMSPILNTDRDKPSRGVLLFALPLDSKLEASLAEQTKLKVKFIPLTDSLKENDRDIIPISDELVEAHAQVKDLFDQPIFAVSIESPRPVYQQGLSLVRSVPVYVLLGGVAFTLIAAWWVNGTLVGRFKRLAGDVGDIAVARDSSKRLAKDGSDEIAQLADRINSMLEALEEAQKEVERARDAAEAANQAKSTFIAKVSHELRTPIHGVVGMLRILMKEETSKSKKAYIAMAKNSAFGLLDTINEILDFSKMETGNLHLESIEFDVKEVVREALRTVAPRAEEKGTIELLVDVHAGVHPTCLGDPLRIKQCLINLLGNSIKFTKDGFVKLIVTSLGYSDGRQTVEFVVEDTGVGIPEDRLPKIFEPFTQADDSVARVFTGTGLGLTIVKQLVEQMGGEVTVTSEVGAGSRFIITVPLPVVGDIKAHNPAPQFAHRRVAVIDSGAKCEAMYGAAFERLGVEAALVPVSDNDSIAALEKNCERFDLIVVTSECLKYSKVMDFAIRIGIKKNPHLFIILSPSEISLRERLLTLELPYILVRPVSVDDICLVLSGALEVAVDAWDTEVEGMGVADRRLRILIADDAETNRVILTSMLHEAGHEVVCVENGLDLVAAVTDQAAGRVSDRQRFDIVLTDVQMPMMDGIAATREVRRIELEAGASTRLPIVAVTAHAMIDEMNRMRESGVDDIVTKPILPSELSRVLQQLTGIGVIEGGSSKFVGETFPTGEKAGLPVPNLHNAPSTGNEELDSLCRFVEEAIQEVRALESYSNVALELGPTPLDVADVYMRSGDSARRSKLIFKAFARSYADPLEALSQGGAAMDIEKVKESSHALKGLLLDIGAKGVGSLAADIENACKRGDGEFAFSRVPQLDGEVAFVGKAMERLLSRLEESAAATPSVADTSKKVTEVFERSEQIVDAVLDRNRLVAEPVRLVTCAEAAMREAIEQLSDSDLYKLIPPSLATSEPVHPSVELVYQLLDVHDVLKREGNSTNRSLIVFGAFLHGYEELLRELETSSSEKDITRIRETAHSLKAVLRETGCPLGADVAGQIESLCAAGEVDDALGMCESLKRQTRLVGKVVRRIVDESTLKT